MIRVYTQLELGQEWLEKYRDRHPIFACILGFTDTGLIPGISAAGATPKDRQYTCLADAEFVRNGPMPRPKYPLPPLHKGASPTFITRAVVEKLEIPVYLFNAGLPQIPPVPTISLGGTPAKCVTTGRALKLATVKNLLARGLTWGQKLAAEANGDYLILGECVVGGTTTALAVLMGLGIAAESKVNSSHPQCNHVQKLAVVRQGLAAAFGPSTAGNREETLKDFTKDFYKSSNVEPLTLVAGVGDPMQVAAAEWRSLR
ncbi:MAG: TIGR00303 family protein, partial [Okeania sp. SIO2H7]|nr:TIGR00303 family protein [Okeania sp. SIO2H7]